MLEETASNDQFLFRSAANIRRASVELTAMLDSLWRMLVSGEIDLGKIVDAGVGDDTGADWVTKSLAYYAKVIGCRRRQLGTITFLIRLCGREETGGDLPNWPWLDRACLIVGWHTGDDKKRFDCWEAEHFEPSFGADNIRNDSGRVWTCIEEGEAYSSFFVVPVSALKDDSDLKKHVLEPLKALFEGGDPESAFPDGSPVLGVDAA